MNWYLPEFGFSPLATPCICPTFESTMLQWGTLSPFQSVVGVVAQFPNYALAVGCVQMTELIPEGGSVAEEPYVNIRSKYCATTATYSLCCAPQCGHRMATLVVLRFCMSIDDRGELTFLSQLNYQGLSSHFVLRTIHPLVHCPCPRPIHLILHSERRRIDLIFPLHCICPIYFNLFT